MGATHFFAGGAGEESCWVTCFGSPRRRLMQLGDGLRQLIHKTTIDQLPHRQLRPAMRTLLSTRC